MVTIEAVGDGRSNPAASPVVVIRIEGAAASKPRQAWVWPRLWLWAVVFGAGFMIGFGADTGGSSRAPPPLPACAEFDANDPPMRCVHFWTGPQR